MATLRELLRAKAGETSAPIPTDPQGDPSEKDRAVRIVRWVDATLERRIWEGDEIERKIMRRTPEEILREGHICFAAPCFDLTSVTLEMLKEADLSPTMVIARMKRLFQPTGIQVGIELPLDGRPHVIGFGVTSKRCYEGRYEIVGPRKSVHRRPMEGDTFHRCHLGLFGLDSYFELPTLLPGYDPAHHLARFRRMMRPSRIRRARDRAARKARTAAPGHIPSPGRWACGP